MTREDLARQALLMALAAIQADGKTITELSQVEKQAYIDAAVQDLKLALDVLEMKRSKADD